MEEQNNDDKDHISTDHKYPPSQGTTMCLSPWIHRRGDRDCTHIIATVAMCHIERCVAHTQATADQHSLIIMQSVVV